jgi:hypothetical protein
MRVIDGTRRRTRVNVKLELTPEEWASLEAAALEFRFDMGRLVAILTPGIPGRTEAAGRISVTAHLYVATDIAVDEAISWLREEIGRRVH